MARETRCAARGSISDATSHKSRFRRAVAGIVELAQGGVHQFPSSSGEAHWMWRKGWRASSGANMRGEAHCVKLPLLVCARSLLEGDLSEAMPPMGKTGLYPPRGVGRLGLGSKPNQSRVSFSFSSPDYFQFVLPFPSLHLVHSPSLVESHIL